MRGWKTNAIFRVSCPTQMYHAPYVSRLCLRWFVNSRADVAPMPLSRASDDGWQNIPKGPNSFNLLPIVR